ncbi:hypothetical protein [Paracoccus aminovorans]|uniref:hypothetical protein n=1 Tax=Paracoccus aminovorans TaxID=34004 RepID=UPI0011AEBB9B|nr:hypothetical protein [Paracoccus aminovorans]
MTKWAGAQSCANSTEICEQSGKSRAGTGIVYNGAAEVACRAGAGCGQIRDPGIEIVREPPGRLVAGFGATGRELRASRRTLGLVRPPSSRRRMGSRCRAFFDTFWEQALGTVHALI